MRNYIKLANDDDNEFYIDAYPNFCPFCQANIEIISHKSYSLLVNRNIHLAVCCPKCKSMFVYEYKERDHSSPDSTGYGNRFHIYKYGLTRLTSPEIMTKKYESIIIDAFPRVIKILAEAEKAQRCNLTEVAGMGYRKALEFLIKEYVIQNLCTEDKKEEVKSMFLGKVIESYIENTNIKKLSKRAAWLGNDETHYERRWPEKDIKDLVKLLEIVIHYISMELSGKKLIEEMPE